MTVRGHAIQCRPVVEWWVANEGMPYQLRACVANYVMAKTLPGRHAIHSPPYSGGEAISREGMPSPAMACLKRTVGKGGTSMREGMPYSEL